MASLSSWGCQFFRLGFIVGCREWMGLVVSEVILFPLRLSVQILCMIHAPPAEATPTIIIAAILIGVFNLFPVAQNTPLHLHVNV